MPERPLQRLLRMKKPLSVLVALALTLGCSGEQNTGGERPPGQPVARDLPAIEQGKTLTALVSYNSTGYFLYRGEPMGYEYELLRKFAEERELDLRPVVVRNRQELWQKLNAGEGDAVAARLLRSAVDEKDVAFTTALYTTAPALIQRDGTLDAEKYPSSAEPVVRPQPVPVSARSITSPAQLAGETVHLERRSPHRERLLELEDEISGDIEVVEVADATSVEALIRRVARGELRFTVAPENVAKLKSDYFTNINIQPAIGPPQRVVWALRKNSPRLLEALNAWIANNESLRAQLYKKYFEDRRGFQERVESRYLTSETGTLSDYDELFRQNARRIGWDWRLLASQAYQESRFKPDARSWAGAVGLLQLMPGTAREVGVRNSRDPQDNVRGAVTYLEKLTRRWSNIADPDTRLRFILASYNAGPGHIDDARRLAAKHGANVDSWPDVAFWLLQKSKRKYYTDPVVKHGFVRGLEPVTYVSVILERFDHYRQFVRE